MDENKRLKITGTILEEKQLEQYMEKIASNHIITTKSDKNTYPIPILLNNYNVIKEVYELLNEHLKLGINIHPAGEWLLDNFYIIEETVKQIQRELPLKKYINFVGIQNGEYKGFARVYVLAAEILAYSDNKIDKKTLENCLKSYQNKKTLSMDEIWNIGLFLQIAIIEDITDIALKIYSSQMQKIKAENIVKKLIENKEGNYKSNGKKIGKLSFQNMKYPFIEYMSFILKRYGKKGNAYLNVLEEVVEKLGMSVAEVIKKEHFEIAIQKVLMGNSITSIKEIQRINFLEIFEKLNGVEEILKQDPANVYSKMDYKTKEYYRTKIKEISKKSKISEIYIARKCLELANEVNEKNIDENKINNKLELERKRHIGYFLIDDGINDLYKKIEFTNKREETKSNKAKIYIISVLFFSICLSLLFSSAIDINKHLKILAFILFLIPASEVVIQTIQFILSKIVKPKIIPKIDFSKGIDEENVTFVIIPTILKSKKKVKESFENLEKYYIANKSKNIYFALLGDCSESNFEEEKFDIEVAEEGKRQVEVLNKKYSKDSFPIFSFFYRNREWNEHENKYIGWERKRGLINQFNEYILKQKNPFKINTLEDEKVKNKEIDNVLQKIKYVITLDSDTDLTLNSAFELVGTMAHILNKPIIDENKNIVINGYGIMQPRIGINLDICYKNLFTKIFAGDGGIDSYTNAISDIYQDNFGEGIYTGKGIYDLKVFEEVMKNKIPENTVLSHDLLEGSYLRCGLVSDIMLMDGYPSKYTSFMNRLSRWIRGDWQIIGWIGHQHPLNLLSKYKIIDNLRRSLLEDSIFFSLLFLIINTKDFGLKTIMLLVPILPYIFELINFINSRRKNEEKQKSFTPKISGLKGIIIKSIITLGCLPYKAYISLKSIIKTLYRLLITQNHLLEWTTSEDAEKNAKTTLISYYKNMFINLILGAIGICLFIKDKDIFGLIFGFLWIIMPCVMWYISKEKTKKYAIEKINSDERKYVENIGKRTWEFFNEYLKQEYNFLIPDNFQVDRKEKIVKRTSSTNIGLSMLAVISACDLNYIKFENGLEKMTNIINTIQELEKWNGHLYNWYNIETKEPLAPRYISTVDSGNFVRIFICCKIMA